MRHKDNIEKTLDEKRLKALLTPSWLSGLLSILIGLVITGGVILTFNLSNNGSLKQQLTAYENTNNSQAALTLPGESTPTSKNSLQNTWPLIAFWGMIGLVVYFLIESIIKTINELKEFSEELNYVHAKRDNMVRSAIQSFLLRLLGAIIWLIFLDLFIKRFIPYSIAAAHASVVGSSIINSIFYAALSFVMVVFGLHVNVVFLRFVMRKIRIFSSAEYLDV